MQAKLAAKAGITLEEARRIIKVIDQQRLEMGDEAFQQVVTQVSEIVRIAEADGVSPVVLLEAMSRRLS
jgi:hypothetical protein